MKGSCEAKDAKENDFHNHALDSMVANHFFSISRIMELAHWRVVLPPPAMISMSEVGQYRIAVIWKNGIAVALSSQSQTAAAPGGWVLVRSIRKSG
jgi:hypothetical protein